MPQRARRTELVAEIRGHIETALDHEEAAAEAAVRNVLDRLGPPERSSRLPNRPPYRATDAPASWRSLHSSL
jgi:hypothetical protein